MIMNWPMLLGSTIITVASLAMPPLLHQDEGPPLPASLTDQESAAIRRERGAKSRVEVTLRLAETRLGAGLTHSQQSQHQLATQQLIVYTALLTFADQAARAVPAARLKDRDQSLKRIEQAIFRQNPRLEAIIRELPFDYREASLPLVEQVRRIRLQAINDLLGGGAAIQVPEERQ